MTPEQDLKDRTKKFSIRCINLAMSLPNQDLGWVIRKQLIRCATSVAANYRASCRARSKAEFVSKLGIVEEEADESMYWMELIMEYELQSQTKVQPLHNEANEILSIVVSSIRTARSRKSDSIRNPHSKIQN